MQLHQFLRYIHDAVPIMIFNLKDMLITSVRSKEEKNIKEEERENIRILLEQKNFYLLDIDIDLYEYVVLDINLGPSNIKGCNYSIYITIEK